MKINQISVLGTSLATALALGLVAGCGGGSTSGGDGGETPVFTGGNQSGSISIDLNEATLAVANTTGFIVSLRDENRQAGSSGTKITCDSEKGVAIIEPSSGSEITDSIGKVSGRIGCEAPGSYQFVCRLPGSGSRQAAVTVKCTGTAPNGFSGFTGAGGGNLGGGSGGSTDFDSSKIRISSVDFSEVGDAQTAAIDTTRKNDCDTATAGEQMEPFTDTLVRFKIVNNSGQTVNMSSFSYTVPDAPTTASADFTSSTIAFTGNNGLTIASGKEGELGGFFARATGGLKFLIGSSTAISTTLGQRNVIIRVTGVTDQGEEFELSAVSGIILQDYDKCS